MSKLKIKRSNIIKEINVADDKEFVNVPYIQFKRDLNKYYSNLKISEASNYIFKINGKTWEIDDKSLIKDNATHIMGMILTEEGNSNSWVRVNQDLETIEFDQNNLIWKNIKTVNNEYGEFVEIPPVYTKTEILKTEPYINKTCYWIADYPADSFHLHPSFIDQNGTPCALRILSNWSDNYDYDQESTWNNDNIRAYSVFDHHLLARLMLIEFGKPNINKLIENKVYKEYGNYYDDELDKSYDLDHNYHGIHNIFGTDYNSQYELKGFKINDEEDYTIEVWKNDGSLEFINTGIKFEGSSYPFNCYIDKSDNFDLGDIFIGKDGVNWNNGNRSSSSFNTYQDIGTNGIYLIGDEDSEPTDLYDIRDIGTIYRFVQLEPTVKINIKEKPADIYVTEYYGVPFDQTEIPKKTDALLEDGSVKSINLIWNGENYDPMSPGVQIIKAEIQSGMGIKNDNNYTVTGNITVEEMPEQTIKDIKYYARDKINGFKYGYTYNMYKIPRENIKDLTNIKVASDASHAFEESAVLEEFPKTFFVTWDTSEVINMNNMFHYCTAIKSLDLTSLDVSNVIDMSEMFETCSNLETLNISGWDTSKVENFSYMFSGANNLKLINGLEDLKTNSATNISKMFSGNYERLNLSKWNTSNVNNMSAIFCGCGGILKEIDLRGWDTKNVRFFDNMFINCSKLERIYGLEDFDLRNIDENGLHYIFYFCKSLKSLDLRKWTPYISRVKALGGIFGWCTELETILNIEDWDTSNATDMQEILRECKNLVFDLSNWDTGNVKNMKHMISGTDLTKITGWNNINTSNVTTMGYMFSSCKVPVINGVHLLKIDNLNTNNLVNIDYMFEGCDASVIDIAALNTNNVTSMHGTFSYCKDLNSLNLPDNFFTTGKIKDLSFIFEHCTSLPTVFPYIIDVKSISSYSKIAGMFRNSSVREITLKNASSSIKNMLEQNPHYIGHNEYKTDGFKINFI